MYASDDDGDIKCTISSRSSQLYFGGGAVRIGASCGDGAGKVRRRHKRTAGDPYARHNTPRGRNVLRGPQWSFYWSKLTEIIVLRPNRYRVYNAALWGYNCVQRQLYCIPISLCSYTHTDYYYYHYCPNLDATCSPASIVRVLL